MCEIKLRTAAKIYRMKFISVFLEIDILKFQLSKIFLILSNCWKNKSIKTFRIKPYVLDSHKFTQLAFITLCQDSTQLAYLTSRKKNIRRIWWDQYVEIRDETTFNVKKLYKYL
jgi:hypothetical protein